MTSASLVFVVDDDDSVRDSLQALLISAGFAVSTFASARDFLAAVSEPSGCLIADIRMPDMDGLELQQEILRRGYPISVIVITGHGDVPLAVRAMKAGAIDFIEKPFDDESLLSSVRRAVDLGHQKQDAAAETQAALKLLSLLTPRERSVMEQLVAGRPNKIAAHELGISPRTIEIHRANIMDKLNVRSVADLVRISLAAQR